MHKLFFSAFVLMISFGNSLSNELIKTKCSISGQLITHLEWENKIYLSKCDAHYKFYSAHTSIVIDSATVEKNGKFKFDDLNLQEGIYRLSVVKKGHVSAAMFTKSSPNFIFIYIEHGSYYKIKGEMGNLYLSYEVKTNCKKMEALNYARETMKVPFEAIKKGDNMNHLISLFENRSKLLKPLIDTISNPELKIFLLNEYNFDKKLGDDKEYIANNIINLKNSHPHSFITNTYYNEIAEELKLQDIHLLNDPLTDSANVFQVDLIQNSDSRYILIHFWATWCGPCIKEIENTLKPTWGKYKHHDIEFVGVSLDENPEKWQRNLRKLKMDWRQYNEIDGFDSEIAIHFKVTSLPRLVLIDKLDNKIIAPNLSEFELEKKIVNLFK